MSTLRSALTLPSLALVGLIGMATFSLGQQADAPATAPSSPDQRAQFEYLQLAPVEADGSRGEVPYERYEIARRNALRMSEYSFSSGRIEPPGTFQEALRAHAIGILSELGPAVIGGRTRALVFDPTNPNNFFSASPGGGVWESTDGGATWLRPTMFYEPTLVTQSLVLDPTNPSVAYAGTGDGFFAGNVVTELPLFNAERGSGIYKNLAIVGGSWSVLANTQRPTSTDFDFVYKIVVSRGNNQRVYAATKTGVLRSLDGGTTW